MSFGVNEYRNYAALFDLAEMLYEEGAFEASDYFMEQANLAFEVYEYAAGTYKTEDF